MDEFNNRIEAQRRVLGIVNGQSGLVEELCGLSRKSLERWLSTHRMTNQDELAKVLFEVSAKLFFLSTKSQEQVCAEYRVLSDEVRELTSKLERLLASNSIRS